jgi:heptosyltransferase II
VQRRLACLPGPRLLPNDSPRLLLVMRLPLGDTLFVTPTIRALRQRYPGAQITALAAGGNAPLLAHNADLDDTVVLPFHRDWRGGGALPATLRLLLHRRYDLALCFSTPGLGWLPAACGIPRQEFPDYLPFWWCWPQDFSGWNGRHAVELYATAARRLDLPPLEHRMHVRLTPAERAGMAGLLNQLRLNRAPLRIAVHPGSGAAPAQKRWPLCRFAEVARVLVAQTGAQIIVAGGPSEAALAAELCCAIGPAAISLAGRLNLRQSMALVAACDLFVGNDSGPLHLAAAVGTPVVGIYGPTDPAVFGPWAPPQRVVTIQAPESRPAIRFVGGATIWDQIGGTMHPDTCLAEVPADSVSAAALGLLERTSVDVVNLGPADRRPVGGDVDAVGGLVSRRVARSRAARVSPTIRE